MTNLREHLKDMVAFSSHALPGVMQRKMFGCDAWFAGGQIYSFIWRTGRVAVRLPDEASHAEALALEGAEAWTVREDGKPMAHWVLLPEDFHDDWDSADGWIRRAHKLARERISPTPRKGATASKKKPVRKTSGLSKSASR